MTHPTEAYQVNAFADQVALGSPTGVVEHADNLDATQMLLIARSLNFSHTAFLSDAQRPDCSIAIRFFTPNGELKNCAHATIAAHYLWATKYGIRDDQPTKQETLTGIQEVWTYSSEGDFIVSFKQNPIVQEDVAAETVQRLTRTLGCSSADLHSDYPVRILSPGAFRFMVPLQDVSDVIGLRPNLTELEKLCCETESIGCFVFSTGTSGDGYTAHGRMFAPAIGVGEDAVNGNSSGCLGAYLMDLQRGPGGDSRLRLEVLQGYSLGDPSTVKVEAKRVGKNIETLVGGGARLVGLKDIVL